MKNPEAVLFSSDFSHRRAVAAGASISLSLSMQPLSGFKFRLSRYIKSKNSA